MVTLILNGSVFGPAALTSAVLVDSSLGHDVALGRVQRSFRSAWTFRRVEAADRPDGFSEPAAPAPSESDPIYIFFLQYEH